MLNLFFAATAIILSTQEPMDIGWSELVPEHVWDNLDQSAAPAEPNHDQIGQQTGSAETVPELDGQLIRMPGFMLPLDYTEKGMVSAFLLVPYYGACIHVPPPPPNQIVYVDTFSDPVKSQGLWDPVMVTGKMEVKMNINGLGDAAYTMQLTKLAPYDF